jgi:predicted nucleic acid-binding protein
MTREGTSILIDTNILSKHLRSENQRVKALIESGQVVTHPFILGELALGQMSDRMVKMAASETLPILPVADLDEVRLLIEVRKLYTRGIGYGDAHSISSLLMVQTLIDLWRDDVHLASVAKDLDFLATPPFNL